MRIYKKKLKHYAFNELETNTLIHSKNKWWIHPFNITHPDRYLTILAECDKGPLIVEYKNVLGINFHVSDT